MEGLGELLVGRLRAVDLDQSRVDLEPEVGAVVGVDTQRLVPTLEGDVVDEPDAHLVRVRVRVGVRGRGRGRVRVRVRG